MSILHRKTFCMNFARKFYVPPSSIDISTFDGEGYLPSEGVFSKLDN